MYGTPSSKNAQQAPPPSATPGVRPPRAKTGQSPSGSAVSLGLPIFFAAAIALYFVWALAEQHEKLKTAIRPQAIALNLRNIAVMLATVLLGIPLAKVGAVKLNALSGGRFGTRYLVAWLGAA